MKMYPLLVPVPIVEICSGIWEFIEPSHVLRYNSERDPERSVYITRGAMALQRVVTAALLGLGAYFTGVPLYLPIIVGIWTSLPSTRIAIGGSLSVYGISTIFSSLLNINLISLMTGVTLYLLGNVVFCVNSNPRFDRRRYFSLAAVTPTVLGICLFAIQAIALRSISSVGIVLFTIGVSLWYSVEFGFGSFWDPAGGSAQGIFEKYFRYIAYYIYKHRYPSAGEITFSISDGFAMAWR